MQLGDVTIDVAPPSKRKKTASGDVAAASKSDRVATVEEALQEVVTEGSNIQANKQVKSLMKLQKKRRKRASELLRCCLSLCCCKILVLSLFINLHILPPLDVFAEPCLFLRMLALRQVARTRAFRQRLYFFIIFSNEDYFVGQEP